MNSIFHISKRFLSLKEIPQPKISSGIKNKIFGHLNELQILCKKNNSKMFLEILNKKHDYYKQTNSSVVKLKLMNSYVIVTKCPEINKAILLDRSNFQHDTPSFKKVVNFFFPESLIVAEGEKWKRQRKIIQRAINKTSLDLFLPAIIKSSENIFKNFNVNEEELIDIANKITFDSFHIVMYGWDPETISKNKESLELLRNSQIISNCIPNRLYDMSPLLWKLPTAKNKIINTAKNYLKSFALKFIEEEKKKLSEPGRNSLLREMLIATLFDENDKIEDKVDKYMSVDELHDNIQMLLVGAYDTTSNTIKNIFYLLATNPEYQEKLRSEIINFYKDKDFTKTNMTELNSIEYLTFFIDEVNRLMPFTPFFARHLISDTVINGYKFSKDVDVIIEWDSIVKDPEFFGGQTDLDKFRPDRWMDFKPQGYKGILPFGYGQRMCPGKMIAMAEMKILLSYIIPRYRIVPRIQNEKIEFDIGIGVFMKDKLGNVNFNKI